MNLEQYCERYVLGTNFAQLPINVIYQCSLFGNQGAHCGMCLTDFYIVTQVKLEVMRIENKMWILYMINLRMLLYQISMSKIMILQQKNHK